MGTHGKHHLLGCISLHEKCIIARIGLSKFFLRRGRWRGFAHRTSEVTSRPGMGHPPGSDRAPTSRLLLSGDDVVDGSMRDAIRNLRHRRGGGGATLPRSCEVRGDRQRAQPTLAMGQASSEASGGSVTLGGGARLVVEVCSPVKAVDLRPWWSVLGRRRIDLAALSLEEHSR
jgi:hypothetical protein